jgi:hypothetical protein
VQELLDAFLIANGRRHGDRVFRSPGEQVPDHYPPVSDGRMRPVADRTIHVSPAVHREEYRSKAVGTLCINRRSKRREALDQSQLPGEDAPVKSIVTGCVARLRQVWLPPQDGVDLLQIPGDDCFLQLIELGRVVKPLAHRPQEHVFDLAMPALSGREKHLVP